MNTLVKEQIASVKRNLNNYHMNAVILNIANKICYDIATAQKINIIPAVASPR